MSDLYRVFLSTGIIVDVIGNGTCVDFVPAKEDSYPAKGRTLTIFLDRKTVAIFNWDSIAGFTVHAG